MKVNINANPDEVVENLHIGELKELARACARRVKSMESVSLTQEELGLLKSNPDYGKHKVQQDLWKRSGLTLRQCRGIVEENIKFLKEE